MEMPRSLFSESLRAPLPASSAYGSPKHPTGRLRRKKAKKTPQILFHQRIIKIKTKQKS